MRLVNLTGPGGVGKTRLAIKIAAELEGAFDDGAHFVDLTPVRDPDLVVLTIAHALDLRELADRPPPEQLAAALRTKHLLLVLDNFEQIVDAAPRVTSLLRACPRLKVLVTSRAVLRVTGEQDFPVPSLPLPEADDRRAVEDLARNDAVALFVTRAEAANPRFALTAENAAAVAEICARLDGLPLALELAAAWLRVLSPQALLDRLQAHGRPSLQLLTGGARDLPARQQTLRDTIAWSYDLLTADERSLFRHLAVFAGSFSLDGAEAICPPVNAPAALSVVASLVDKSLVEQVVRPDGVPRFRILETIREFGLEQLAAAGETDAAMQRLAGWFRSQMEGVDEAFLTAMQGRWVLRLEAEHDNLRAVLAWAIERGDAATVQGLVEKLAWFWFQRGYLSEGRTWGERALAFGDASPTPERAATLGRTASVAWLQGDRQGARELAIEGLRLSRQTGCIIGEGNARFVLGWIAEYEGRFDEAEGHFTEALRHFQTHGIATWAGFALNYLGHVDYERGNVERAAARFEEARDVFLTTGNTYGIGVVLTNLGRAARLKGDHARAAKLYTQSLVLRYEQGDKQSIASGLRGLALVAAATRQHARAARLWGAEEALREAIGAPPPRHTARAQEAIAAVRRRLGEEGFATAWAAGRALSLADAVAEALQTSPDATAQSASIAPAALSERYGLTPREVEVLRLIADGRSNPEIADALCITPRTAQTHVQHILDKLDVGTRTEAATVAMRHGLLQ